MRKFILVIVIILIILASYIFSGNKSNPPVKNNIAWNSLETREQFYKSCADCHSNETDWPWYANFAPVSWYVINDVEKARKRFNISEREMGEANEAADMVELGAMPLSEYLRMHPEARMDSLAREQFAAGLEGTFNPEKSDEEDPQSEYEHNHVH